MLIRLRVSRDSSYVPFYEIVFFLEKVSSAVVSAVPSRFLAGCGPFFFAPCFFLWLEPVLVSVVRPWLDSQAFFVAVWQRQLLLTVPRGLILVRLSAKLFSF